MLVTKDNCHLLKPEDRIRWVGDHLLLEPGLEVRITKIRTESRIYPNIIGVYGAPNNTHYISYSIVFDGEWERVPNDWTRHWLK